MAIPLRSNIDCSERRPEMHVAQRQIKLKLLFIH